MKIKIGRGYNSDMGSMFMSFGRLSANMEKQENIKMTLKEVAEGIANSCQIKNGEINILAIEFSYSTNENPKNKQPRP